MTNSGKFVAVALLTDSEVQLLGGALRHVYPVGDNEEFTELLKAIHAAEAGRKQDRHSAAIGI